MNKIGGAMLPFQWAEEENSNYGEGISRPAKDAKTKEFTVMIYHNGAPPMRWIMRAESQKHVITYAQARWPGAAVEVLD